MENTTPPRRPLKTQTYPVLTLVLLLSLGADNAQFTQPRWVLLRTADGVQLAENKTFNTNPALTFDLSQLWADFCTDIGPGYASWNAKAVIDCRSDDPLAIERLLWKTPHYGCPEPPKTRRTCGDPGDFYCRHWGCENLALTWDPYGGQDSNIRLHRHTTPRPETCTNTGTCNPVTITILDRWAPYWSTGKTWGLSLYVHRKRHRGPYHHPETNSCL